MLSHTNQASKDGRTIDSDGDWPGEGGCTIPRRDLPPPVWMIPVRAQGLRPCAGRATLAAGEATKFKKHTIHVHDSAKYPLSYRGISIFANSGSILRWTTWRVSCQVPRSIDDRTEKRNGCTRCADQALREADVHKAGTRIAAAGNQRDKRLCHRGVGRLRLLHHVQFARHGLV